jgi:hypothetical protein
MSRLAKAVATVAVVVFSVMFIITTLISDEHSSHDCAGMGGEWDSHSRICSLQHGN